MDEDQKKNLKQVFKAEMKPLLIGLRNEVEGLRREIVKLREKKIEEVLNTKETNPIQFPKTQDVNVKNPVKAVKVLNPQKIVAVKGIKGFFENLNKNIRQGDEGIIKILLLKFDELRKSILKVEVQNPTKIKFPAVQKVKITNPTKQKEIQRVRIENSLPREAIPVVLTTAERKRFYDMLVQVSGGSDRPPPPIPRPGLRFAELIRESGGSGDMNVDGSTTPVTFSVGPAAKKRWYIHSISIVIEDAAMNFVKFGGRSSLANGFEVRVAEAGLPEATIGTFFKNGDFYVFTTRVRIESASTDVLSIEANIKGFTGTTFNLSGDKGETLSGIVNDNLTSLNRFILLIQGYEIDI